MLNFYFALELVTKRLLNLPVAMVLLLLCSMTGVSAQILYNQLISISSDPFQIPRARLQLRQVNGDGSGDTAIGLPFANVLLPAWSRDGELFAISAPNPNRPNDRSHHVFVINPANGGIQQITFQPENPPNPQTGAFRFTMSLYKAFSPDRRAIAVSSVIVSGNGQVGQIQATPVLEVFSTVTLAPLAIVRVYPNGRDSSTHHGGEGVDWHPAQNLLVAPVDSRAPFQTDPSRSGQVTALFLLDPVDRALETGRFSQITFPRTDANSNTGDQSSEHDYMPKLSPSGIGVAYVRSFQNLSLSRGGADPNVQSLRILNLNTGADIEVLRLAPGAYVSSLDWSPDGTALVFDLGQQERGINGLQQNALEQTNEVHIINVDGTGARRLRGGGAATPAWKPLSAGPPPPVLSSISPLGGLPGSSVTVNGSNLADTTAVQFNGVNASSFTVESATEITAIVPAGATSGTIRVATASGAAVSTFNFTVLADGDGDGMPDGFEQQNFGSSSAGSPTEDTDGDGTSNLGEYRAGTDPLNPQSVFRVLEVQRVSNGLEIAFRALATKRYAVQASASLSDNFPLSIATTGRIISDATLRILDPEGGTSRRRFYRVVVLP